MGMDYFIIPDIQVECDDNFPEGLSFFFEQIGGYGEYAEVEQVSRILQIDLSVFQEISFESEGEYDEGNNESEVEEESHTTWHDVKLIVDIVNALLNKIDAFPDYYKQVIHSPNRKNDIQKLMQTISKGENENAVHQLETLQAHEFYNYPYDKDYLSKGKIVEDLIALRETLQCYQGKGVSKIKLLYM